MTRRASSLRIAKIQALAPPSRLLRELPLSDAASETVHAARRAIHDILGGADRRLLVVVGPCSIHDPAAARDYAGRLLDQRRRFCGRLEIVMRGYFEKPRTAVGWKGMVSDPDLDGSFRINKGLHLARELMLYINDIGLPIGTEFLDMITPQYLADLVAWGAIGARTAESQIHRELASGLPCPIGFKNGTDGNTRIAFDAVATASQPHHFLSVTRSGQSAIVTTRGNEDCHVILRGGAEPNYDAVNVAAACRQAEALGLPCRLMIDASHGNSRKDPLRQREVIGSIHDQLAADEGSIVGVMIESHLVEGRQEFVPGKALTYGQSITDACTGWDDTVEMLDTLADGVDRRADAGRTQPDADQDLALFSHFSGSRIARVRAG